MRIAAKTVLAIGTGNLHMFGFSGIAFLCPVCRSVNSTEREARECRASHQPELPPTNEDR